jgi:plasmid stability protein
MPTLKIKNLPDALYRELQARAKRQHRTVAQEAAHILADVLAAPGTLAITGLRGLGKEHWGGRDAARHVEEERSAWD